jgi:hypothetical protein
MLAIIPAAATAGEEVLHLLAAALEVPDDAIEKLPHAARNVDPDDPLFFFHSPASPTALRS